MATWDEVMSHAPELAALAQARIEATGMGLVATIRSNGFPRLSGVEPRFRDGHLWIGMMPDSWKAKDLLRDPRLCLHNATSDPHVGEGDAKITGRAVEADLAMRERYRQGAVERGEFDPGTDFHLFTIDVTEVATIRVGGDHLIIESWREGQAPKRVERR